ncbi:hypothetical protein [Calidifontibacillus oryziterrae]|uniref:hypothetical protein n=1 Tax=Calidifontibacillus oryziterrae TaxID=1191699 RepID=UPI0002FC9496|nr:hypothetical protein [Calidifontibacillus oryziterrae]
MKFFLRLNFVNMIYALMAFVPLELMLNVYRMSRLTDWSISTLNILIALSTITIIIGGTILLFFLTKKWLRARKAKYWTAILWFPYFVVFVYLFANLFPITYGGDTPNPVTGLLAIAAMVVYPFYILLLNFLVQD